MTVELIIGDCEQKMIALLEENARFKQEVQVLRDKLDQVRRWCRAYPVDVFPEPDWILAKDALRVKGIALDSVTCSAMRRVTTGIVEIIGALQEVE